MSNKQQPLDGGADRGLEQLFARAQPRPMPPLADEQAIRSAVFAEWDAKAGRRIFARRAAFAAAASVVLAMAAWTNLQPAPDRQLTTIAHVERVNGSVEGSGVQLALGGTLSEGSVVTTGNGQAALRLESGGSLRIGSHSSVLLDGLNAAELLAGVLYFDSESQRPANNFTVTTNLGSVRDVGTQFFARLDMGARRFDVGVRDGRVELSSGQRSEAAGVGERLSVTQTTGSIRRDEISVVGDEWDWAERLAPPFDIDGRTVSDFLDWFASQTGRQVFFASPAAERVARETVLNGAIDLPPMQKLSAVIALTDLKFSLDGNRVIIEIR